MSDAMDRVLEFHTAFNLPRQSLPGVNAVPERLANLRQDLIEEEVAELWEGVADADVVKIADALADVVYVAYGTALTYGIDLDAVLEEVHRSNMTKTANPDGGKVLKGRGYSPPDVLRVLSSQRELLR